MTLLQSSNPLRMPTQNGNDVGWIGFIQALSSTNHQVYTTSFTPQIFFLFSYSISQISLNLFQTRHAESHQQFVHVQKFYDPEKPQNMIEKAAKVLVDLEKVKLRF